MKLKISRRKYPRRVYIRVLCLVAFMWNCRFSSSFLNIYVQAIGNDGIINRAFVYFVDVKMQIIYKLVRNI